MSSNSYHQHWLNLKAHLPTDTLTFIRLGDFWETFDADAKSAAPIMNVALTKRGGIPMCGFPIHAQEIYLKRLIEVGKTAALASRPTLAESFAIERVITPPAAATPERSDAEVSLMIRFKKVARNGGGGHASTGERVAHRLATVLHEIGDDMALLDADCIAGFHAACQMAHGPWATDRDKALTFDFIRSAANA